MLKLKGTSKVLISPRLRSQTEAGYVQTYCFNFSCNENCNRIFNLCSKQNNFNQFWIYCSDPLEGGGTIYSTGFFFFVQWIFAARYIHRRELRLVSLESSFSVEYGIKKIFLIFVFYRELSRLKLLRKEEWIHVVFIHIFRNFCLNFRQFC